MKNPESLSTAYDEKSRYYYKCMRDDIVAMLPKNKRFRSVLEIGASGGYTLLYLKNNGIAEKITGIELFNLPDTEQNNPAFEKFIIGDVEQINADAFDEAAFDLIICADVLEHLADPWNVRDKLIKLVAARRYTDGKHS
jgi:2-polyprenyl-3-methyl-5-hydroxy-6-metoxy-1,4-benzoquinol methylase